MEDKIVEIIIKLTGFQALKENRNIDLLEEDILDSLAFIELIESLEEEFEIEIQPTTVSPDIWRKVSTIAELVSSLKNENI